MSVGRHRYILCTVCVYESLEGTESTLGGVCHPYEGIDKINDFKQPSHKEPTESSPTLYVLKRVYGVASSSSSWTFGRDHNVLVIFFFFLIPPVSLMCTHLEERRDFTRCPDEQKGSRTSNQKDVRVLLDQDPMSCMDGQL